MKTKTQTSKTNIFKSNLSRFACLPILLSSIFLVHCGESKTSSTAATSTANQVYGYGTNYLYNGGSSGTLSPYISECNGKNSSTLGTNIKLTTFRSPTGAYFNDVIRLKLSQLPSNMGSDYIQIHGWEEQTLGSKSYSTTALELKFQLNSSYVNDPHNYSGYLVTDSQNGNYSVASTYISADLINTIISLNNLSNAGITLSNFFQNVVVSVMGVQANFEAFTLSIYDESNSAVANEDMLIPSFYSNPNTYVIAKGANSLLPALHPNISSVNSGSSDATFYNNLLQYCL